MPLPPAPFRSILIASVTLVALVILLASYVQRPEKHSYLTSPVLLVDIENIVLSTGRLDAFESVNVGAQVSGQVNVLKVKVGDHVTKGQLIACIDDQPQRNSLRNAEAAL